MSEWMYRGSLDRQVLEWKDSRRMLPRVFQLAHWKRLPGLHNIMIDIWREDLDQAGEYPHPDTLGDIYRRGLSGTPVHAFILKKIVYCMMTDKKHWQAGSQEFEDLYTTCSEEDSFTKDLLREIMAYQNEPYPDPASGRGCHFHVHTDGSPCKT